MASGPSIDEFDVTVFKGRLTDATLRTETDPMDPARNGQVVNYAGWETKADIIQTRIKQPLPISNGFALKENYRALMGSVVQVVDSIGQVWPTVIVMKVVVDVSYTVDGYIQVDAEWTLLPDVNVPNG